MLQSINPVSDARRGGGTSRAARTFASTFRVLDGKSFRVRLQVALRVELHAVEHLPAGVVLRAVGDADLLHGFRVDVAAHDLARDALVIRRARDHAPAAE